MIAAFNLFQNMGIGFLGVKMREPISIKLNFKISKMCCISKDRFSGFRIVWNEYCFGGLFLFFGAFFVYCISVFA